MAILVTLAVALLGVAPGTTPLSASQPGEPPAPLGPPGWSLIVAPRGAPADQSRRHAWTAAFTLREGQSLDPGIPGEAMTASYAGVLSITEPGRYRFAIQVEGGTARLSAFGQGGQRLGESINAGDGAGVWTPWAALPAGAVTVSIQFTRAGGAARLRTLWEKQGTVEQGGFPPEPIPASVVTVPRFSQRDAAAADSVWRGRVLMGELNCTGCHRAGAGAEAVLTARAAPMLGEIGARATPAWLRRWVADPQRVKPGCGMPDVIGESARDLADADAITHFLASCGRPAEGETSAGGAPAPEAGRRLYHTVGCVACHGALEPPARVFPGESRTDEVPDSLSPHPFGDLRGKWRADPLARFLKEPLKTHPAGRMPSMLLSDREAAEIAAYLAGRWGTDGSSFEPDPDKVETGKVAFAARGCAACHQLGGNQPGIASTLRAKPLADVSPAAGCLSATDQGSPRFGLSEQDRADLVAAIAGVNKVASMSRPAAAPLDEGERLIAAYGCLACHTKDERGGPPEPLKAFFRTLDETELGDEGRLPPRLSGVGNKLTPAWIRTVLTDAGRARPYMGVRMPQFGKLNVGRLHTMLVAIDGAPMDAASPFEPKPTDELILAGRRLVGEKGMNCISCHAWSGKTAGTPGPDITGFAQRLRYDWWKSYVIAPARYKPGTRMTPFYSGGLGPVKDVFGGDPYRQTDALWAYFAAGAAGPAPEGLFGGQGIPVAIGDRPVVFRTFLKDAGNRGIAVGFPIGVHFAFDAEAVRLAEAWQGDFLDASKVWKGRGGETMSGLGRSIWTAPPGPPLVIGALPEAWPTQAGAEAGYKFLGYRLEEDGTPVFLYTLRGPEGAVIEVSETPVPKPRQGFLIGREFALKGLPSGVVAWFNAGKPQQCSVTGRGGTRVEERAEGARCWGISAHGSEPAGFIAEIAP